MSISKEVGQRIRMLRHEKKLNQEYVAKDLKISIPAYSKIETGITDVNLSRLEQIAGFYGLTAVELLSEDQKVLTDHYRQEIELKRDLIANLQAKVIQLMEENTMLKHGN